MSRLRDPVCHYASLRPYDEESTKRLSILIVLWGSMYILSLNIYTVLGLPARSDQSAKNHCQISKSAQDSAIMIVYPLRLM